jgi:hypothetical protein
VPKVSRAPKIERSKELNIMKNHVLRTDGFDTREFQTSHKAAKALSIPNLAHFFARWVAAPLILVQYCLTPQSALAGYAVRNTDGQGVAFASGWTAAKLAALAAATTAPVPGPAGNTSQFRRSGAAPPLPSTLVKNPSVSLGPNEVATDGTVFNRETFITVACTLGVGGVSTKKESKSAGGDMVSGGGLDLLPYVTPTSYIATASLTVNPPTTNGDFLTFTGTWTNSDAGSASSIQFYDVTDTNSPVLLGKLMFQGSGTTSTNGSFSENIAIPASGASNILSVGDMITTSIPGPQILSASREGANANIIWQGTGGHNYSMQAASRLSGANTFSNIGPVVTLPGSGLVITNYLDVGAMTNSPARFYRVEMIH